ncbi:MAG: MFS transporter [Pseudomonadota bacterium]
MMLSAAFLDSAQRPRFKVGTLRYSALGLASVVLWLLVGELGLAMRDRALMPASLEVLSRYAASDHHVSLLLSGVPAVLSLFVSPLIGPASDRFRGRWGRRRPFLLALAPIGGLALLGIAASHKAGALLAAMAGGGADEARYALTVFGVSWTIFCAVMLCVQALYIGLVNDVLPRAWLGRFFGIYRSVSLGVGIAFYLWVFPLLDEHPYKIIAMIAVLFTGMIMLMSLMVREGEYPPPTVSATGGSWLAQARAGLNGALTLPQAGWMFGALILGGLSFGPFNTFSQYYAASLGISKTELGQLSSMAYGASMGLALLIGIMVDRIGAVRMSLLVMGAYSVCIGVGYFLLRDANAFRGVYLLHVVLSGAYFTAAASLPMALLPRLDFLRYCAFRDLIGSLVGIALSMAQGAVLDRSGHDYRLTLLFAACCGGVCALCLGRLAFKRHGMPEES